MKRVVDPLGEARKKEGTRYELVWKAAAMFMPESHHDSDMAGCPCDLSHGCTGFHTPSYQNGSSTYAQSERHWGDCGWHHPFLATQAGCTDPVTTSTEAVHRHYPPQLVKIFWHPFSSCKTTCSNGRVSDDHETLMRVWVYQYQAETVVKAVCRKWLGHHVHRCWTH